MKTKQRDNKHLRLFKKYSQPTFDPLPIDLAPLRRWVTLSFGLQRRRYLAQPIFSGLARPGRPTFDPLQIDLASVRR